MIELAQRVLAVAHATHRAGECLVVLLIYGHSRRHLEGVLHREAVHLVGVADCEVLADGDKLVDIEACVHASREVLEVSVFQYTVVLLVSDRHKS